MALDRSGSTQVPSSPAISKARTASLFSSAKAKPTQPKELSAPAMPSMITLSLGDDV